MYSSLRLIKKDKGPFQLVLNCWVSPSASIKGKGPMSRSHDPCVDASQQKSTRRIVASEKRIADAIAAGQKRGLTATKVLHYPDGTTEVQFGYANGKSKRKAKGWDI